MKLSLICEESIRIKIVERFNNIGIYFYQDADLSIVQKGFEDAYIPCIVFDPSNLDSLYAMVEKIVPTTAGILGNKLIGVLNEELCMINYDDILFIESIDGKSWCHTSNEIFLIRSTLYKLEHSLSKDDFFRTSKSYIVNINNVSKIIPWFNRRLLLKFNDTTKEVEVSKNYVNRFKEFLGIR